MGNDRTWIQVTTIVVLISLAVSVLLLFVY